VRISGTSLTALAVAALLAALSLVTWRQSRTREALVELDRVQRAISLVEAERAELQRRIQVLESRGRVVRDARERLGMRNPEAGEIVLLPGDFQ
jgi:cell division protein FtsL